MTMTADADLGYSVHRRSVPGDYNLFSHTLCKYCYPSRGVSFSVDHLMHSGCFPTLTMMIPSTADVDHECCLARRRTESWKSPFSPHTPCNHWMTICCSLCRQTGDESQLLPVAVKRFMKICVSEKTLRAVPEIILRGWATICLDFSIPRTCGKAQTPTPRINRNTSCPHHT